MMYINKVQSNWTQKAGTSIEDAVPKYYNLFYFPVPIEIRCGDEVIVTKPNACVFSEPKQPRGFYFAEQTTMCWMHNEKEIAPLLAQYNIPLNCVFYPSNPAFIPEMFRKMRREFRLNRPYKAELMDCYVRELIIKLSRSIITNEEQLVMSRDEERKMHILRQEILSNPLHKWTVADMAKKVMLSPSRFHAVYKLMFNSSPMKDVISAKIDHAKAVLLSDNYSDVVQVAESLGYSNQYHFIRQFKEYTGVTPGAYRKNNP